MHPLLAAWRERGRSLEVGDGRLFVVEAGSRGPTLLILHGFPTSSLDFHRVLDDLAAHCRVIVHDHLGFGLSDKPPGGPYTLADQARRAAEAWARLGVESGHLVAHDYGTSVATELLALREEGTLGVQIESVTLSNGSVYRDLARLLVTQRVLKSRLGGPLLARLAGRGFFHRRMLGLWGDPSLFDASEADALWDAVVAGGGRAVLPRLSAYLDERVTFRDRWIGALSRYPGPVNLVWGRRDPIAVPAIPERLLHEVPTARLAWLDSVGHYPMLEAPGGWTEAVLRGACG